MLLARYQMIRGKRPADDPLPDGVRQNTQHRTNHCLRPTSEIVDAFLSDIEDPGAFPVFKKAYLAVVEMRFKEDRTPFDQLSNLASEQDVYLGCNCPTRKNPDVNRCHTVLALQFMKKKYPGLDVRMP